MKKPRNRKLLIQIGVMMLLIFTVTLAWFILTDYSITEKSFLSAKHEMIDRDLNNISSYVPGLMQTDWFWHYAKEHSDDIIRDLTDEEKALYDSKEIQEALSPYWNLEKHDFDNCDPTLQLFLAREYFKILAMTSDMDIRELQYASIDYLEFPNEHEAYLYLRSDPDEPQALTSVEDVNSFTTAAYATCFQTVPYEASEHSAVREILSGNLNNAGETLYEVYHDPSDGKDYYLGYTPVIADGKICCWLCIRYDWTQFRSELISHAQTSMIMGFVVLAILNTLLLLYIYRIAIRPLSQVKEGVQEYMHDKNSAAVTGRMDAITARNEVGVLADNVSALAEEIDRYTEENRCLGAEKERIATELSMSQIQPHFLFNSLNTIRALCVEDPKQAEHAIETFSAYLRQNLEFMHWASLIPLSKEVEHARLYTEIEQLRFPDIRVEYHITEDNCDIPPLTIQPLVENAIRHGIRGQKDGTVIISAFREDQSFVITVQDNGTGFNPEVKNNPEEMHIGIRNVRSRVEQLSKGEFILESHPGEGTLITIRIPANDR